MHSDKFYRLIFESVRDPIIVISPDGRIIDANNATVAALGYSREELLQMSAYDLRPAFEISRTSEQIDQGHLGGVYETVYMRKDGTTFPVEISTNRTAFNGETAFVGIIRDITERKKIEEALRESETRFRQLLDRSPISVALYDEADNVLYLNKKYVQTFGYTLEDISSVEKWWPLAYPDPSYREKVMAEWAERIDKATRESKDFEPMEAMVTCKDGTVRCVEIYMAQIGDVKIVVFGDITRRKHAEKKLKASELRFKILLHELEAGVLLIDREGGLALYNPAFLRIFNISEKELASINIADISWATWEVLDEDGNTLPYEAHPVQYARLNRTSVRNEVVGIRRYRQDRVIWTLISVEPLLNPDGSIKMIICTFTDITRLKETEEALVKAKAQAELYMELMGHDINNMNQSALGYLELALHTLEVDSRLRREDREFIERPMRIIAESSALIDKVRKLQKLIAEGVKTMPTDLDRVFRELDKVSFNQEDREVRIHIPHIPGVVVEANELLKDVFVNLISNAIKHSDVDQPLTIEVKVEPVTENGRQYYSCAVEDNGPGIPDSVKSKLFYRFQRGATKAHGKGLGLYLVRTLVEGYGGRVWVEDRVPGDHTRGAKFVILLPATRAQGDTRPSGNN
ncbi:PAS domain S-box protein [Methanocella sp. MCL-LM]|uniref:PAS domain-containing protein n=1 Tax=Methanocella sp. MCL-LM TaxID=3412035 RepID=UPI003C7735C0